MKEQDLLISILNNCLQPGVHVSSSTLRDSYTRSTQISHWDVRYSRRTDLPEQIVLKSTSNHLDSIKREGAFYSLVQKKECSAALPPFIGWRATPSEAALAMEDMTPVFQPATNKPSVAPPFALNEAIFYSLCTIHNDFLAHHVIREFSVDNLSGSLAEKMSNNRELILKNLGARSGSATLSALFLRLIDGLPALLRLRFSRGGSTTIIHGDFHPGNVLVSQQDEHPHVLIIDWPNWQPGFPTDDLAYYLTLCFPPGERAIQEIRLLESYYQNLSGEFRSYCTWKAFQSDYRVSILRSLAVAFLWLACESPQDWPWESLEFVLDAYRTWTCDSLLDS